MKSHRDRIVGLQDSVPPDFDPESHDINPEYEPDSDDDAKLRNGYGNQAGFDARAHYEDMGPSSFRKRSEKLVLGDRYAGSTVSRDLLMDWKDGHDSIGNGIEGLGIGDGVDVDVDEEDHFAAVDDESNEDVFAARAGTQQGSEGDGGDSDESTEEPNGIDEGASSVVSGNGPHRSSLLSSQEESESESREDDDALDGSNSEATSDMTATASPMGGATRNRSTNGDRAALKALLFSSDSAALASSLSAAAAADAKKGQAVKAQYRTYDRLLDARIKMQKGLAAANSMTPTSEVSEHRDAIQGAEEAAIALWNTVISTRHAMIEAQAQAVESGKQKKRKRPAPASTSTPLSTLWSVGESISVSQLSHHRAILNKWSNKIRASNPSVAAETRPRQLGQGGSSSSSNPPQNAANSITDVIDAYLGAESEKMIARSTTGKPNKDPSTTPDPIFFDDTPFYQSLLRDLVSSRSASSSSNPPPTNLTLLHPKSSTTTPDANRKTIDTKASKGRKIRYNVHEKLQNFMAAQDGDGYENHDRHLWASAAARTEFFGSLMGQGGVLDEIRNVGSDIEGEGEGEREGGGLKLFSRS